MKRLSTNAKSIYDKASRNGLRSEGNCSNRTAKECENFFKNSTVADKKKIDKILVKFGYLDKEELKWYNPYKYYKTDTHLIRIHSCTDYFYKIL